LGGGSGKKLNQKLTQPVVPYPKKKSQGVSGQKQPKKKLAKKTQCPTGLDAPVKKNNRGGGGKKQNVKKKDGLDTKRKTPSGGLRRVCASKQTEQKKKKKREKKETWGKKRHNRKKKGGEGKSPSGKVKNKKFPVKKGGFFKVPRGGNVWPGGVKNSPRGGKREKA